jgi:hypothetical protein
MNVFQSVKNLHLRDDIVDAFSPEPTLATMSEVTMTKSAFPNLRSLTLEPFADSSFSESTDLTPLPKQSEVPSLTDITIVRGWQSDRQLLAFLELSKCTVRSVTLKHDAGTVLRADSDDSGATQTREARLLR